MLPSIKPLLPLASFQNFITSQMVLTSNIHLSVGLVLVDLENSVSLCVKFHANWQIVVDMCHCQHNLHRFFYKVVELLMLYSLTR